MNALFWRRLVALCASAFAFVCTNAQVISITPAQVPQGDVGSAYSTAFSASGGTPPYRFSVERGRLPNGMSLTDAGLLSGTPTQFATVPFEIWVTDFEGREAFVVAGTTLLANVLAVNNALPNATLNTGYTQAISVSGGGAPYSCSLASGSLPPGITLNASCTLSGTPNAGGTYTFAIAVSDGFGGSATQSFTVLVTNALGLALNPMSGRVGVAYSGTVVVSGGTSPYTCSLVAGNLPPGLTLSTNCVITGSPVAAGSSVFTIQATDNFGGLGLQSFNLSFAAEEAKVISTLPFNASILLVALLVAVCASALRRRGTFSPR